MASNGEFSMTGWEETDLPAPTPLPAPLRLSHGRVTRTHSGILTGQEVMHFVLAYSAPGRSVFRGQGVFEGTLDGRDGRFLTLEQGEFRAGGVTVTFELRGFGEDADIGLCIGTGRYETDRDRGIRYAFTPA